MDTLFVSIIVVLCLLETGIGIQHYLNGQYSSKIFHKPRNLDERENAFIRYLIFVTSITLISNEYLKHQVFTGFLIYFGLIVGILNILSYKKNQDKGIFRNTLVFYTIISLFYILNSYLLGRHI